MNEVIGVPSSRVQYLFVSEPPSLVTFAYITVADDDDDNDGIGDPDDNCPTTSNNNQADTDGDAIGDVCGRRLGNGR